MGKINSQIHDIYKQWETSITHTHASSATCARGVNVDTHFRDTFFLQAQFMYYVLFYSFKYGPSPCDLWWKLRKCGLEGMSRFLSELLHEPNPCMPPSGQGTLVAPQAHERGLIPRISTSKELSCSR